MSDDPSIIDHPIEEAALPDSHLSLFHPTYPGQLLDNRFTTIVKLGCGAASTVWLARHAPQHEDSENRDTEGKVMPPYVAIKITALHIDPRYEQTQLDVVKETMARSKHGGHIYIRYPIDKFDLPSPYDASQVHVCMV